MPTTTRQPIGKATLMRYSATLDGTLRHLTDDLTPDQFATWLHAADDGDLAAMIELSEEMEAKDPDLQNVLSRRREGVTALPWRIDPDTANDTPEQATAAAEYCEDRLSRIKSWGDTLKHLITAVGPGLALTEKVWQAGELVGTRDVPGHRLLQDPTGETQRVHILTEEARTKGIPAVARKFVIHTPHIRAGFPIKVCPSRALGRLFIISHYAVADWAAFSEIFGIPFRAATIDPEVEGADEKTVADMLDKMGGATWGVFPTGVTLDFKEAARSSGPHEALADWCSKKMQILVLGQTLTTDAGAVGSLALGKVHQDVRAAITLGDLADEADMIREGFLAPMTALRFPGGAPVPHWVREVAEDRNLDADRLMLEQLRFAKEMRLPVDPDVLYEKLNIPRPRDEHVTE